LLVHVKALNSANLLSRLFYLPIKEETNSFFAGSCFEVIKRQYLGKYGHIAITTNDIHRAIAYLKEKDISVLPETAKEKDGKLKAIYIAQAMEKIMKRYITFGEIMLRLRSPNLERFFQSPLLEATFGGGEANVAVGLAHFGLNVAYVSVIP